jgi:amidase
VKKLAALVGKTEDVTVGDEPLEKWMDHFRFPQGTEAWAAHGEWIARVRPRFGAPIQGRFDWARAIDTHAAARARARREEITRRMEDLLRGNALLVLPSAPGIAPLRNSPPAEQDGVRARALPMLCIAGLARLPQVSLPLATLDGCPLGLSVIAARGNDTLLLDLAKKLT